MVRATQTERRRSNTTFTRKHCGKFVERDEEKGCTAESDTGSYMDRSSGHVYL